MIQIIPAIDVIDGRCVRLTKGDYDSQTIYYKDPCDAAKMFEDAGMRRLHFVDLDGAKSSQPRNLRVLEKIADKTSLTLEFGGGIKSETSARSAFSAGASYIICGSIVVTDKGLTDRLLMTFDDKIILGIDFKDGKVATKGWTEQSDISPVDLIGKYPAASQAICTDISRDGTLEGIDTDTYISLQESFPKTDIIVSGGISSVRDIEILQEKGLRGVIVGKALYEGKISTADLTRFCL